MVGSELTLEAGEPLTETRVAKDTGAKAEEARAAGGTGAETSGAETAGARRMHWRLLG